VGLERVLQVMCCSDGLERVLQGMCCSVRGGRHRRCAREIRKRGIVLFVLCCIALKCSVV